MRLVTKMALIYCDLHLHRKLLQFHVRIHVVEDGGQWGWRKKECSLQVCGRSIVRSQLTLRRNYRRSTVRVLTQMAGRNRKTKIVVKYMDYNPAGVTQCDVHNSDPRG